MKKILFLAALFLAIDPLVDPVHADAAERADTYCASTGIADGGYELRLAADLKTAELAEQSFIGPRNHMNFECEALPVLPFPDALNNYLVCRNPDQRTGEFVIRMFSGGIAGLHYASLRAVIMQRGKLMEAEVDYGRMNCSR